MSPRILTTHHVLHAVVRHRWVVVIPFAIGLALAPLLGWFAPERYRSETLIMVVPQRVPDDYVKPTVTESVADRLPGITNQILSRSRLESIIKEMNLYPEKRARDVMEDVVAQMRLDVKVEVVGREADSFRVSYTSRDPDTAQRVTERLASLYIEQNLTDRNSQAESTSQFLATQLDNAKNRLVAQEKKLEEYRRRHSGQLPTQMQANLQAIQGAALQLQAVTDSLNRAQERRLLIERQIADIRAMPLPQSSLPAQGEAPVRLSPTQQLEIARARLAALQQRYTPDHPEVISLQRTIAELEERVPGDKTGANAAAADEPWTPAEAAQKKTILDLQAELAVVDRQLTTYRADERRLRGVAADYQSRVDAAPTRESELVELTRDYGTLQTAYASLLMKREDSLIAANLERRQIGEQFRILDPASRPERPVNQARRRAIISSGAIVGLLLGLVSIGLGEYRNTSFRRDEEVQQAFNLPVLAVIPVMSSTGEQRQEQRRARRHDLIALGTLATAVIVIVVWQLAL